MKTLRSLRRFLECGWKILAWSFFALSSPALHGELIPADRLYDWTGAGVPGGIPQRTTIFTTLTSTGDATDRTSAINSAISSCPDGSVVLLGPGTFRCNGTININKKGVTLRGSGMSTILDSRASGQRALFVGIDGDWPWATTGVKISANEAKGETIISVESTTNIAVGDMLRLAQKDDSAIPVTKTDGQGRNRLHTSIVTAKTSNTVTILDPLPFAFTTALDPQVHVVALGYCKNAGIEDLHLRCEDGNMIDGIDFWQAYSCWVKNVKVSMPNNYGLYLMNAVHCEIRKVHQASIKNAGSNGAGLLLERATGNRIEDNIFWKSFPHLEVNFGCTGNVYAYNFLQHNGVMGSTMGCSINSNHGAHNSYNLYEGNVASNLQADGYFGSVSNDTLLRNRLHGTNQEGTGSEKTSGSKCVDLNRMTRYYNVVGNILGMPQSFWNGNGGMTAVYERTASGSYNPTEWRLGFPNMGNDGYTGTAEPSKGDNWASWGAWGGPSAFQERDLDVANTLIRKGNFSVINNAIPAAESTGGDTVPASYCYASKPSWFGNLTWPPFDAGRPVIDLNASFISIPAGYRYVNGVDPPAGTGDTTAPSAPANLAVTSGGVGQLNLTWSAATDNVGVTGYQLERSQGAGSTSYSQIATPTGLAFNDTGLTAGTVYNYRLRATDAAGNLGAYSAVVTGTAMGSPDTVAPSVPTNLRATASSASQIGLSWTASTDNTGVTGYQVERSQGAGSTSYTLVTTTTQTSINDAGLSASTTYNYRVRATDAAGNFSAYTSASSASTLAPPPSLVVSYGFEEGTGTMVADGSEYQNNGAISGATWAGQGKYGVALEFDGNDTVTIPNHASLNLSGSLTLEAWVYPTLANTTLWRTIIYRAHTGPGDVNYVLHGASRTNGYPSLGVQISATNLFSTEVLPLNTWAHLAATYDGTTMRLYVNGVQKATQAQTGTIGSSTQPITIGGNWVGRIDEMRIYNRALSQAEIAQDMEKVISPRPVPPTNIRIKGGGNK